MTAPKHFPPVQFLRECFDYNPETGLFRWRTRPLYHFGSAQWRNAWNARFAGAPAFNNTNARGYPFSNLTHNGVKFTALASRVAWAMVTGEHPKSLVDHKDCDPGNTRFSNLREAEFWQNGGNRRPNGSKLKGAYWDAEHQRYRAIIVVNTKRHHLGRFDTEQEAHAAYVAAANDLFGEFARAA